MRLSREAVQRQIDEMWDAISFCAPQDEEGADRAREKATQLESEMWAKLALQDRMDEHAPEMLEALKIALIRLDDAVRLFEPKGQNRADLQAAATRARAIIAKIEKE